MYHGEYHEYGIYDVYNFPFRSLLFNSLVFGCILLLEITWETQTTRETIYGKVILYFRRL